ncbi:MAG: lytic transglycosylase domain-containing protein [Xanthomonadales bacterium]|nr:Soluble lytic murein transglycosylase [Xanthomonadales bacterium]MCC6593829.1 lytic transglycosylase domain-containing protein [Xanthomonadales bacterium]MCE7931483.1 lytic murein transglycosylase [Xanthomonadales bacterium PRO6]
MLRTILACLLLCANLCGAVDLASQRAKFQIAWRIAQAGGDPMIAARGLEAYSLFPYLGAERLRRQGAKADFEHLAAFLNAYGDTLPGRKLRAASLERLGRAGRHAEFLGIYVPDEADVNLRCQAWTARRAIGQPGDATVEALELYAGLDRERVDCRPLLAHLRSGGHLTAVRVRERVETALAAGQIGLARWLLADLPVAEQPGMQRRVLARADAALALREAVQWPASADSAEAVALALQQYARKDAPAAEARYQAMRKRLHFNEEQRGRIEAEIARYAAVEALPQAAALLQRVPAAAFDDNLREWQVRYHLRRLEYAQALVGLDGMDRTLRAQSRWRYIRGRVLELLGRPEVARADFAVAATEANFHGFLAADRLDAAYAICPADGLLDVDRALAVLRLGGVQRALEWQALGEIERARAEWFDQLPRLDPDQRRTAGLILSREGLHEWAIFTLNTEALLRQYEARFPLLYTEPVARYAQVAGLPVHWVYGLIRAESAWNARALSPVGARGLMQLMPATAVAVAKTLGVRAEPLTDPVHNIRLGTTYLGRRVKGLGGNAVLATGAYNAGIGAVRRWIDDPLPPWDLWIETVPYKETREYIARVLAFSVLYDWRIDGSPARLSALIPGLSEDSGPAPVACPTMIAGN